VSIESCAVDAKIGEMMRLGRYLTKRPSKYRENAATVQHKETSAGIGK
jgi:hypothetical protein